MKEITPFQKRFLEEKLSATQKIRDEKGRQSADTSGSSGDGHHDEGYQLSKREVWVDDTIVGQLTAELSGCIEGKLVEQSDQILLGCSAEIDFGDEVDTLVFDNIVRANGVINLSGHLGKKIGDKVGTGTIQRIHPPSYSETIFFQKNQ